jgi:hypothetical protein
VKIVQHVRQGWRLGHCTGDAQRIAPGAVPELAARALLRVVSGGSCQRHRGLETAPTSSLNRT